jgi:hypothetical protein
VTIDHPRIGMDRYIDADWMALCASVVRGEMTIDGVHARLADDIAGKQVQRKVIGILNRMWFPGDPSGRQLAKQAAALATKADGDRIAAFEAVAIGAYPYFRQVMEHVGRLVRLQESCSAGEVHRRMFELHGKRSTIDQATSYCFKTMISWGMLERMPDKRLSSAPRAAIGQEAREILDQAANRSRRSVSPLRLSDPLLFPFAKQK